MNCKCKEKHTTKSVTLSRVHHFSLHSLLKRSGKKKCFCVQSDSGLNQSSSRFPFGLVVCISLSSPDDDGMRCDAVNRCPPPGRPTDWYCKHTTKFKNVIVRQFFSSSLSWFSPFCAAEHQKKRKGKKAAKGEQER
jgi:hypothetical protein